MRNRQQADPSLVDTVRSHSASVAAFFEPALPYATQAAASALAFTAGLVATQVNKRKKREGKTTPTTVLISMAIKPLKRP